MQFPFNVYSWSNIKHYFFEYMKICTFWRLKRSYYSILEAVLLHQKDKKQKNFKDCGSFEFGYFALRKFFSWMVAVITLLTAFSTENSEKKIQPHKMTFFLDNLIKFYFLAKTVNSLPHFIIGVQKKLGKNFNQFLHWRKYG